MSCHCRNCAARAEEEKVEPVEWKLPTERELHIARMAALTRLHGWYQDLWPSTAVGLQRAQWGVRFRWSSLWVGAHWSPYNRRWCINLLPCVTLWVALKGGKTP